VFLATDRKPLVPCKGGLEEDLMGWDTSEEQHRSLGVHREGSPHRGCWCSSRLAQGGYQHLFRVRSEFLDGIHQNGYTDFHHISNPNNGFFSLANGQNDLRAKV
jgi:hypothetical protein